MKKTRSNTFILENEKAWEPAGEGVVRQILGYDGQVTQVSDLDFVVEFIA